MVFDGVDDYVNIDDWSWGGTTSVEAYAMYNSFDRWSRIFDFGSGAPDNSLILAHYSSTSGLMFRNYEGGTKGNGWFDNSQAPWFWSAGTFVHVVVTVEKPNIRAYKDGALFTSRSDNGNSVTTMTRTYHWLGRSVWGATNGYLDGTIAYLRIWHGHSLSPADASTLYSSRHTWCVFCFVLLLDGCVLCLFCLSWLCDPPWVFFCTQSRWEIWERWRMHALPCGDIHLRGGAQLVRPLRRRFYFGHDGHFVRGLRQWSVRILVGVILVRGVRQRKGLVVGGDGLLACVQPRLLRASVVRRRVDVLLTLRRGPLRCGDGGHLVRGLWGWALPAVHGGSTLRGVL
jgi:hypothetical protein